MLTVRLGLGMILAFVFVGINQGYANEFIPWSEDQKLTVYDFLGTAGEYPESYERPDPRNKAFTWGSVVPKNYDSEKASSIICQYQITQIESYGRFHKKQSWVREEVKSDPNVLNHEQGHFDIMEVYARKTESALLLKIFECPDGIYNESVIKREIRKLADGIGKKVQEMHDRYDDETDKGSNLAKQRSWDGKINSALWRYHQTTTDYSLDEKPRPKTTIGVGNELVTCKMGWKVVEKHSTGKLFCVTPAVASVLEEREWGRVVEVIPYFDP